MGGPFTFWYSEEGPGRAAALPSPLIDVPNVTTTHQTTSVPTSYYSIWHYSCLCPLKGESLSSLSVTLTLLYRHDEGRPARVRVQASTSSSVSSRLSQLVAAGHSHWVEHIDVGQLRANWHHVACHRQQDRHACANAWQRSSTSACFNN